jgi:hypothetical protein
MKKIAISLFALAAVSTAAFANSNRSEELRDLSTYVGQFSEQANATSPASYAIAVPGTNHALSNAELIKRNQEKNATSGH